MIRKFTNLIYTQLLIRTTIINKCKIIYYIYIHTYINIIIF